MRGRRCKNCGDWIDYGIFCSSECENETMSELERKSKMSDVEILIEEALAAPPQAKLVIFEEGD